VKLAEQQVSGEVVPVFVERSHHYPEALWRSIAAGMVFTGLLVLFIDMLMGWKEFFLLRSHIVYLISMMAGGGILAGITIYFPGIRRRFCYSDDLEQHVHAMAERTFYDYGLFQTSRRSGILILMSLFERRVEILGDAGINEKVSPDEWKQIIDKMLPYLKREEAAEALVVGIRLCKELLLRYGFEAGPDDRNELPDHLRQNLEP
jgi:putative membrane protein